MVTSPPRLRRPPVRPDGSINVERLGIRRNLRRDLYHALHRSSWPRLLGGLAVAWVVINAFFAYLYTLQEGSVTGGHADSFTDAFFFSVQTLSTIGYGSMSPATPYAHFLVTVQAALGILITALTTGLAFAKFAIPTARVMFSKNALITTFDGEPVFMFRMANERSSQVVEASLRVVFIRDVTTKEGEYMRRFLDLELVRASSPVFALGWTAFHRIDESSPLHGLTLTDLEAMGAGFLVVLSGTDESLAAVVHARYHYQWSDLLYDRRFVDLVHRDEDGPRVVDYRRFHDTQPLPPEVPRLAE